jgi:glycosyltransferase involved in cell wall biosynthesis
LISHARKGVDTEMTEHLRPGPSGLTAVLPCYNEGGAQIESAYREVTEALGTIENLELLFIDDGSVDDTLDKIKKLAETDPRVHFLSFTRNFGLRAATTAGFRYAGQPWSVQLDSDMQFPAIETWSLLDKAAEGFDIVFGIRRERKDPWHRRVGARLTYWMARKLLGIQVPVGASSFRVARTAVGRTIVDLPTPNPHFVAKTPEIGARYATVPVGHVGRGNALSTYRVKQLGGDAFALFFGFSWRPLNATYLIAALATVAAVVLAVLGAIGVTSLTALAVAGLLVSSVSVAAVAIVGRYLHRRLLDVRPRRAYYIRESNVPVSTEDTIDGGAPAPAPPRRPLPQHEVRR